MMDAALLLEIDSLRKRLSCAVAIQLMSLTVEEIKETYSLDYNFEE